MSNPGLTHADFRQIVDSAFPFAYTLADDPSGWAVVDERRPLEGAAVALEATPRTIEAAADAGASVLLVHHPPFFTPLRSLRAGDPASDVALSASRYGIDLLAAHTNVDCAPGGLSDRLCELLGLEIGAAIEPLSARGDYKLTTFVPSEHADVVADAIFNSGGGVIGDYARCGFRSPGLGSYLPLKGADPYSGRVGAQSREPELRIEVLAPRAKLPACIAALVAAHPYEEPAYDVYPLERMHPGAGLGRWAQLPSAVSFRQFTESLKHALGLKHLRRVGRAPRRVKHVAVCTGSGRSLIGHVAAKPGTLFVTGELGYHDQRRVEQLEMCALEAGHFGSERIFIEMMADTLSRSIPEVPIVRIALEREPAIMI
ncbi:MAG: Nif3-like dinuclear metal center hexameric protein [Candidatus Alcyoniella australis]|nr:Nif3-like dinuclear metal center hexameric protein [Candidatus Alcyoniella australis]